MYGGRDPIQQKCCQSEGSNPFIKTFCRACLSGLRVLDLGLDVSSIKASGRAEWRDEFEAFWFLVLL